MAIPVIVVDPLQLLTIVKQLLKLVVLNMAIPVIVVDLL